MYVLEYSTIAISTEFTGKKGLFRLQLLICLCSMTKSRGGMVALLLPNELRTDSTSWKLKASTVAMKTALRDRAGHERKYGDI